jgi:Fe-S-cluster-containing hydrogenase component 2
MYNDRVNDPGRSRIRIVKKHSLGVAAPVVCRQCRRPPCLTACPVDAIRKDPDGLVRIDEERCIGCEACVAECPFGMVMALPDRVVKCELCGGDPQCVRYCATGAIEYADPGETARQKRARDAEALLHELEI